MPYRGRHRKQIVGATAAVSVLAVPAALAGLATPASAGTSDWRALAECESGMEQDAYNPAGPYYGYFQFAMSTWQAYGGEGDPRDASYSQQLTVARNVAAGQGAGAWPACTEKLGITTAELTGAASADLGAGGSSGPGGGGDSGGDAAAGGSVSVGADLDGDGDGDYRGVSKPKYFGYETADPANEGEYVAP